MSGKTTAVTVIASKIFIVRGQKVILDHDLAQLYEVETKHLTRQVRRNKMRFPSDFMFQLTKEEYLRCQNGASKRGGSREIGEIPRYKIQTISNNQRIKQFMPV